MDYTIIIKEIRNILFLTQTELAEKLGVSLATVCRWEKGTFEPTMKAKRRIAELCKENNIEIKAEVK